MKRLLITLLLLLSMTFCMPALVAAEESVKLNYEVETVSSFTAYVRVRKSGSRLNLRMHPRKDARVIKKLPTGTEITVTGVSGNYYQVEVGGLKGYVQSRYVVMANPMAVMPRHTYYPPMNSLSEPKLVAVSPERRGGYVNMRIAPSRSEPVMKYLYEDDTLYLLAVDRIWVQVMDPETRQVGYVMRHFICGL